MKTYVTILLLLIYSVFVFAFADFTFPTAKPVLERIGPATGFVSIAALVILALSTPFLWRRNRRLGIVSLCAVLLFLLIAVLIPSNN